MHGLQRLSINLMLTSIMIRYRQCDTVTELYSDCPGLSSSSTHGLVQFHQDVNLVKQTIYLDNVFSHLTVVKGHQRTIVSGGVPGAEAEARV